MRQKRVVCAFDMPVNPIRSPPFREDGKGRLVPFATTTAAGVRFAKSETDFCVIKKGLGFPKKEGSGNFPTSQNRRELSERFDGKGTPLFQSGYPLPMLAN